MPGTDTIAAIATAPGIGGIGVLRISGAEARVIGEALTLSEFAHKRVHFRQFFDESKATLDHGIAFYCAGPHSFTGEDVVEIQAHGGPVLLDMLLERICALGARPARAGEFSERAFVNGKLDLAQAEAIADLIESGSRAAAKAAMRSLQGEFSSQIHTLVDNIIALRSYVEAALDFADEEIDFLNDDNINRQLVNCQQTLDGIIQNAEQGRVLKEGLHLVLAGLPNAGKSSLLNYLAGYDAAIVTDIPGTTRDVLRENISLKGIPLRVHDTAGLRDSDNPVEQEGIKRAWQEIHRADAIILLVDARIGISVADKAIVEQFSGLNYHLVFSKSDLLDEHCQRDPQAHYISVRSGDGLDDLIDILTGQTLDYNQENQTILARRRHLHALHHAGDSLRQAIDIFEKTGSGELMAEDLRFSQQHLSEITGEFTSDDLLGSIFSRFCIGK